MIRMRVKTNNWDRLAGHVEAGCAQAVATTSFEVHSGAARRSRVKTGTMRRGWTVRVIGRFRHLIGNPVTYAIHHEYGTHKMSAQPMLTPEIETARPRFLERVRRAFTMRG